MDKYAKRRSNFEPLTKILGDYSNSLFLRAVRNVMFEKTPLRIADGPKYIWQIRRHSDCPMEHNYVTWIAKKIIAEQVRLRKMVWFVNGWGNPYPPHKSIRFVISPEACVGESYATFKMRCENKIAEYVENVDLRDELLRAIYDYGHIMNSYGYAYGNGDGKEAIKNKLIDIFNMLEYPVCELKKIIDEE
jgi:hypothetical protein